MLLLNGKFIAFNKAKEIFLKLAKEADVIVENFTPGVMDRFGLGYDVIKKVNPGIVFCSVSGFGQTGPYRSRPAYDQIMQGISGLMSITGEPDGEPQKVGIAVADIGAGSGYFAWRLAKKVGTSGKILIHILPALLRCLVIALRADSI